MYVNTWTCEEKLGSGFICFVSPSFFRWIETTTCNVLQGQSHCEPEKYEQCYVGFHTNCRCIFIAMKHPPLVDVFSCHHFCLIAVKLMLSSCNFWIPPKCEMEAKIEKEIFSSGWFSSFILNLQECFTPPCLHHFHCLTPTEKLTFSSKIEWLEEQTCPRWWFQIFFCVHP